MNSQLEATYRELSAAASKAQYAYLDDRTPANWNAYLAADEALRPVAVKFNQARMQAQIDAMSAEDFAEFRQRID